MKKIKNLNELFDRNILLIGAEYSGKSFLSDIIVKKFKYEHYCLGDIVRQQNPMGKNLSLEDLIQIIDTLDLNKKFVIDKAFKNQKQLPILEYFHEKEVPYLIFFLERKFDIDLQKRNRIDDQIFLKENIEKFEKEKIFLLEALKRKNEPVIYVENLGQNFKFINNNLLYKELILEVN